MSATDPSGRWQPRAADLNHEPSVVRWMRKQAGLSARALARELEVSPSLITEIEKGTRNTDDDRLRAMAAVFGCPVEVLRSKRERQEPAA